MSTLIVTAHPDPGSLTHRAAHRVAELVASDASFAHLAQERFDPRFTLDDRRAYLGAGQSDPAIQNEQQRIDAVEHLVLVFPVYWWSMPALLKGWIDRVFIAGWAFDADEDDRIVPRLQRLTAHLLPVSGTAEASFARHGYRQSFATQIEGGILDFCGIRRGGVAFLHDSESTDRLLVAGSLETAASAIAAAIERPGRPDAAARPGSAA